MSDQEGDNEATASPAVETQQHQIPKYRLDEEIARNRRLESELDGMKGLLQRLVPQQQAQPNAPEDPEMLALKEENPALYKILSQRLKEQEYRTKQVSASNFAIQEQMDRGEFIKYAGPEEANRLGNIIEKKLDELRKKDIFTMNRTDLYNYIVGQEAVNTKRRGPGAAKAPQEPNQTRRSSIEEGPSSDPQTQGIHRGAAPASTTELSLEELEKKLANQEF